MATDAQIQASMKWSKNNVRKYNVSFNIYTESDLLAHLESKPNKSGYIKELIRADMARHKN